MGDEVAGALAGVVRNDRAPLWRTGHPCTVTRITVRDRGPVLRAALMGCAWCGWSPVRGDESRGFARDRSRIGIVFNPLTEPFALKGEATTPEGVSAWTPGRWLSCPPPPWQRRLLPPCAAASASARGRVRWCRERARHDTDPTRRGHRHGRQPRIVRVAPGLRSDLPRPVPRAGCGTCRRQDLRGDDLQRGSDGVAIEHWTGERVRAHRGPVRVEIEARSPGERQRRGQRH
jgi:hypothetical protein